MIRPVTFVVLAAALAGCASSSTPVAAPTPTPPPPSPPAAPSPTRTAQPCPHLVYGANGSAGPLYCAHPHRPNPAAVRYYDGLGLLVTHLDDAASPQLVLRAMCADLTGAGSSYPIEGNAYRLTRDRRGWSFGVDPEQEMLGGAC